VIITLLASFNFKDKRYDGSQKGKSAKFMHKTSPTQSLTISILRSRSPLMSSSGLVQGIAKTSKDCGSGEEGMFD
jgi:hypothetical protein